MAGAVDLSALKAKADAGRPAPSGPDPAARSDAPAPGPGVDAGPGGAVTVIDVTDETFGAEVVERSAHTLVVVDLWAEWCQPCKQLSPVLEKLAAEAAGDWVLAKVDVDAAPGIAQAFRAQSIPMVVAVAGGRPVDAFAGVQPEAVVRDWLAQILEQVGPSLGPAPEAAGPEPVDPRVEAAESLADEGDYAGARAAYEAIVHAEPGNREAAAAARQMAFLERTATVEPDAVERADAAPRDVALGLAAADAEVLAQRPAAAFARLIALVKSTAGDERADVRTRLVELLDLFDPADPLVLDARRGLAAALY
ncbi:tetratricopeptide repeat protein [Tsukamurella soli]